MDERQGNLARAAVALAAATLSVAVVAIGCADPGRQVPSSSGITRTIPSGSESEAPADLAAPAQPNVVAPAQPNAQPFSPNQLARNGDILPPMPKSTISGGKTKNGNANNGSDLFNAPQHDIDGASSNPSSPPSNAKVVQKGKTVAPAPIALAPVTPAATTTAAPPPSQKAKRKKKH